jgi:hypothetical protein
MNSRKIFLSSLFELLDANSIRYCIMRNYDDLFNDATSDIDFIVMEEDLTRFKETLHKAAARANQRFVQRARYVNYSYVFWDADSSFLRIDFETEVRWRPFPILPAISIMESRQRRDSFFIPHPRHESAILFVAAIWRNALSDRYRRHLARLYEACPDKEELRRTYCEAFGHAGETLFEFHAQVKTGDFNPAFCARLKRSILLNSLLRPARLASFAGNTIADARRFWERLCSPAGISLLFASSAAKEQNMEGVMRKIEFLFPAQKCVLQKFDLTKSPDLKTGLGIGLRLKRLRTLFKGGLFVRFYQLPHDTDLLRVVKTHSRFLYPSRTFICMEDSKGSYYQAHVSTGFMADSSAAGSDHKVDKSDFLIGFIATVLEKTRKSASQNTGRRGAFAVLIGLDGSGKTTLARNIARLAAGGGRFEGVRYFHWRPRLVRSIEFPLPDYRDTPRKLERAGSPMISFLSSLRLIKNVFLANLAYRLKVLPLLRRNYLVIIDRYFYNYYLDPVSVRYYGPAWFLSLMTRLFPKPEQVITLNAGTDALLRRKQELTISQIAEQSVLKKNLDFGPIPVIDVDAGQAPDLVASTTMAALAKSNI